MSHRLGVVISAGGSAFEAMARIVGRDFCTFVVITDRECGGEDAARRVGASLTRISARARVGLSDEIANVFNDRGVDRCVLQFDRLVSSELYRRVATYNIHPSLLPSFPGMAGVADAYKHKSRVLGCSLHEVDCTIDGGPLVAQIACGVDPGWTLSAWEKRAYLMKVYCGLVWVALMTELQVETNRPVNSSHSLPSDWFRRFKDLQYQEGIEVV